MSARISWLTWPWRLLAFTLWYSWAVITHNLKILRDGLTPGQSSTPGIARYETHCRNDGEVTMLSTLVTLTPGTLVLGHELTDADPVAHVIYVHGMYARTPDALRAEVRHMERRMLHAIRRKGET